jgi:hypothetical protein
MSTYDCPHCGEHTDATDACARCRREIHESWHKAGFGWVRREECHENCPGLTRQAATPPPTGADGEGEGRG